MSGRAFHLPFSSISRGRGRVRFLLTFAVAALLIFGIIGAGPLDALAIPVNEFRITSLTLEGQDLMRAQYYEFHKMSLSWEIPGSVQEGQYFTITLDPDLNLHPNTLEQLSPLKYMDTVIADLSVDVGAGTITYTFNSEAEGLHEFSGLVEFNVSIKGASPTRQDINGDGVSDVQAPWDYFKAGTKETITITAGDESREIVITHIGFPTVPESIYNINSWMNTTVIEHAIPWAPSVTGDFIQTWAEVTNNDQYQDKSLTLNPPYALDMTLDLMFDPTIATFETRAPIKISTQEAVQTGANLTYSTTDVKYFSYDLLPFDPASSTYTIDFAALGYPAAKPANTRYIVEYFMNHISAVPYSHYGTSAPTNMATISYLGSTDLVADAADIPYRYFDGAFWFPTTSRVQADANAKVLSEFTSLRIVKRWDTPPSTTIPDVTFRITGDGEQARSFDYATNSYIPITDEMSTLTAGAESLTFNRLPFKNAAGATIVYDVAEVTPAGFESTSTVSGMEWTFTNTSTVDIPVSVRWLTGVPFGLPYVQVRLYADGLLVDRVSIDATTDWSHTFRGLPYLNSRGEVIDYTIEQDGYTLHSSEILGSEETGFVIPLAHLISIDVSKVWVGKTGSPTTVKLFADGVDTGKTIVLNATQGWKDTFVDLVAYHDEKEIVYTVNEVPLADYTWVVSGSPVGGFTITNTWIDSTPAPGRVVSTAPSPTNPPQAPAKPARTVTIPENRSPKTADPELAPIVTLVGAVGLCGLATTMKRCRWAR